MSAMEVVSLDPHRFPFALPVASSHYNIEHVREGSTPFASAPSSPGRSKVYDLFYSVPSSPHSELETFSHSTDLQASVPFCWEAAPGTPKRSSISIDPEFEFNSLVLENRRTLSAPTSPRREQNLMFELRNAKYDQRGKDCMKAELLQEGDQDLDSDFQFSSSVSDAESSTQMSSADELFFKGKILPLKLPPRLQGVAGGFAFDNSEEGSAMLVPQSPKSPRKSGDFRMRSILLSNSSLTEVKHGKGNSRQGWAKALTPSRLFRNDQRQHTAEVNEFAQKSPSTQQIRKTKIGPKKSVEFSFNHLHISDVNGGSSLQAQNIKASSHVQAKDGQNSQLASLNAYDSPENVAVKKWYDKDGDKRTKNGAARSWPRPSVRSVLATRSTRDTTSSKQGTLAASHDLHYRHNRVTSEQMRRKTFLPYKQSLLGCLGFSNMKIPGLSSTLEAIGR